MALLEVKNLTVGIKKGKKIYKAADNISFSINEGEIAGIAGESGCGKTMTALSITNLLPQGFQIMSGEITFNDQSLTQMSEKELCRIRGKQIGMIFQEVRQSLNPLMKVGNQIIETLLTGNREPITDNRMPLIINNAQRKKAAKTSALEILEALGFDKPQKIFDAFPHQLSRGMCQRVMAAIAAISRPRLLLADEPSSALDEDSQRRILSLLLELNQNNKTSILIISHDLSIIRQFCSRFFIMYAGKIIEESSINAQQGEEYLYSPLHPYTKALIAALPGKDKRGKKLENIPGKVPSIEDSFTGCPFAPRCPKAKEICYEKFPPEYFGNKNETNKKVYCYFPEIGEFL